MKYLIVGLGNMGVEYEETRHNVGFEVVDALAKSLGGTFRSDRYGDICEVKHKGRTLLLLKPSTFMNLSGNAVRYWLQKAKIDITNLVVVVDDTALPFATIRIREKGNDGGHNGLKHITQMLGTQNYARLRFGIGNDYPRGCQVDYVLGKWTDEEFGQLKTVLSTACEAILSITTIGIERAMNFHNTSKRAKNSDEN